jgi:hypothetical protein
MESGGEGCDRAVRPDLGDSGAVAGFLGSGSVGNSVRGE